MLIKIRENIFLGDEKVTEKELKENGITVVEVVTMDEAITIPTDDIQVFAVGLYKDKINKPHVKDIACHIPKYMIQNGETVAVISKTGLVRAAFVVARAICELESKSIYEVLVEMKDKIKIPNFDLGKAYL